jgi:ferredoxin
VTVLDQRNKTGAATVRVEVDYAKCEGHGLCEQVGPQVYQLDDDGELILLHGEDVPAELEAQATSGARSCPVAALTIIQ